MALLRKRRLGGWVQDTALDYADDRWRVTIWYLLRRVVFWFRDIELAGQQRAEAVACKRPRR